MKVANRNRMKLSLRQISWIAPALFLLLGIGFTLFFNVSDVRNSYGATSGEYRSNASGNWSATSTWQKYNGSAWVAATAAPTSSDNIITILSGHTVTMAANVVVDQVLIKSGGTLILNSGITMTVANGSGTDLDVAGTFKNAGTVSISASAVVNFQGTGVYQHNFTTTGGTIPTATWTTGSTCEIMGYTNSSSGPSNLQDFSNFKWNCPSQTQAIVLGGSLDVIMDDFTMTSTGTGSLIMINATAYSLGVGGDYNQTGGTFILSNKSNANPYMNLTGNYIQSGGTFSVVTGSNAGGNVNVSGNWQHTGGTLTVGGNSSTSADIYFANSGVQTFVSSGTVSGNVDYTVNSGSKLSLGANIVRGRNFTLASGGEIMIGSTAGITSSGSTGNIQSSGTRTFSTSADYTYNGSGAQTDGSALPSTIRNLTVNNSSGLTLTSTAAVTGTVTMTTGKITTGTYELQITNNATSSLTGYSSTDYIIGNLRRTVSGTGSYDFPLGTTSNYELANLTLTNATGFTNVLGKFTSGNPVSGLFPLSGITLNNLTVDKMLTGGYWSLTPNLVFLTGTAKVTVNEKGWSNVIGSGSTFCVLNRISSILPWQSVGTHNNSTQSYTGGTVTAVRSALNVLGDFGIGYAEYLYIKNPLLISGTDGAVGAIYKFTNIASNIDAWVEIKSLDNGATLDDLDHFTAGYDESWQPFVVAAGNTTSSILWQFTFKLAGTSTDTVLPYLAITGIDIDGDGGNLKEFVEATMPYSYATGPSSNLTIINNSGRYRAVGSFTTIDDIDTTQKQAMFQINYRNISGFSYRTGAISTKAASEVRQNSLFFRPFFTGNIALPIKLVSFQGKLRDNQVKLTWETAAEVNNDYFTVERSTDGENFEKVATVRGAGNSSTDLYYTSIDEDPLPGYSFYRLRQTDYDGHYSYSEVETIKNKGAVDEAEAVEIKSIAPNPFDDHFSVNLIVKSSGTAECVLLNSAGGMIARKSEDMKEGYNSVDFDQCGIYPQGIYFVTVTYNGKTATKKIIKN